MSRKPVSKIYYKLLNFVLLFPTRFASGIKYYYHFDKKAYRNKPLIVIGDHASRGKCMRNMYAGITFKNVNLVLSYIRGKESNGNRILSKIMRCILMKQMANDVKPIREIISILNKNGGIFLLPEGRFSYDGSCHSLKKSIAKLIKFAGVDVIICNSHGAYLHEPYYSNIIRKGKQEYHFRLLFSSDDLKTMCIDEIYERVVKGLNYNDFQWNQDVKNSYFCENRNAEGIENILYYCPKCGSEFTLKGQKNEIICENCGNSVHLDDKYCLTISNKESVLPYKDISEWYNHQRKMVREAIKSPDFHISYECEMWMIDENKKLLTYNKKSDGVILINHKGITFTPKKEGQNLYINVNELMSFFADIENGISKNFLYYREKYIDFRPISNKNRIIKYMIIVEELRNIYHEDWM